jgi:hypothetical protein
LPQSTMSATIDGMGTVADNWWNEDRRDLFRSVKVIASDGQMVDRLGAALGTILNDLELYDDPRQGASAWLFENELQPAELLGEELHNVLGNAVPVGAGAIALASSDWPKVRGTAATLLSLMEANGDYTR